MWERAKKINRFTMFVGLLFILLGCFWLLDKFIPIAYMQKIFGPDHDLPANYQWSLLKDSPFPLPYWMMVFFDLPMHIAILGSWLLGALALAKDRLVRPALSAAINWIMITAFVIFGAIPLAAIEIRFSHMIELIQTPPLRPSRIVFLGDPINVKDMSQRELLDSLKRNDIHGPFLAVVLYRLRKYPNDLSIDALMRYIDDDNVILEDRTSSMASEPDWALGENTIGKVAIASLEKITHKTFSGVEEWKSWYERERK